MPDIFFAFQLIFEGENILRNKKNLLLTGGGAPMILSKTAPHKDTHSPGPICVWGFGDSRQGAKPLRRIL